MYTMESSLGRKLADLASASSGSPGVIFDARGVAVVLDGRGAVLATPVTAASHAVTVIASPQALREACGTQGVSKVAVEVDGDSVVVTAGDLRWSHPHNRAVLNALPDWRSAFPALTVARVRHFTVSVEQLREILAACEAETVTLTLDRDGLNQPVVVWGDNNDKYVVASIPPHNAVWWWDPNIGSRMARTFDKVDVLSKD